MAIVSISEAARLAGKTRATIHRHINTGVLSKTKDDTGKVGIDTSELIRVYSISIDTDKPCTNTVKIEQHDSDELNSLKTRLAVLENENIHLKDHVESLKHAMLLLEHHKEQSPPKKNWWAKIFSSNN